MSSPDQFQSDAAVTSAPERRRNTRFPFSATVEAVDNKSGTKAMGRSSDLGRGGCYVDTISPFPVGTEATIRITRGSDTFEAKARVVYSLMGMGMGLVFLFAQPKDIRVFQRWLSELSGQSAPKEAPAQQEAPEAPPAEKTQTMNNVVLSALIATLIQKKVLTETEGKDLLRKLFL